MIDGYEFGKMVVGGKEYSKDLRIFPSGVKPGWWRKEGHRLQLADLEDILARKPKILVVGTGHEGCMEVDGEVEEKCRESGIKLITLTTAGAVREFNRLAGPGVYGLFHLTC